MGNCLSTNQETEDVSRENLSLDDLGSGSQHSDDLGSSGSQHSDHVGSADRLRYMYENYDNAPISHNKAANANVNMDNCLSSNQETEDVSRENLSLDDLNSGSQHSDDLGSSGSQHSDQVDSADRLRYISEEVYTFDDISALRIIQILKVTKILDHESDQRILLKVASHIEKERVWKMKNCELIVIIFNNITSHVDDRVKQLVIKAGGCQHKIRCLISTDGEVYWKCQERVGSLEDRTDAPIDFHPFPKVSADAIDIVLNNSKFLSNEYEGDDDPVRIMDQNNRKLLREVGMRIQDESPDIQKNLKLRIKLYDAEGLTEDRVKYIDVVSGTGDYIIECYRQEDGTLAWIPTEDIEKTVQSLDIPEEVYTFDEISALSIIQILNGSFILKRESDRRMLLKVSSRVATEPKWKMTNCMLIVILLNVNGNVKQRVKQIVIKAGEGQYKIVCSENSDGDFQWKLQEQADSEENVPAERYKGEMLNGSMINKVLNQSRFLEKSSHRNFVASVVRNKVDEEIENILTNCTLTIELEDFEDAGSVPMKCIIIVAGKGENKIRSSQGNPWQVESSTMGASFSRGARSLWNNTFGRAGRLLSGVANIAENAALDRARQYLTSGST